MRKKTREINVDYTQENMVEGYDSLLTGLKIGWTLIVNYVIAEGENKGEVVTTLKIKRKKKGYEVKN